MKILAVPDPRVAKDVKVPEPERRFALQQWNNFVRLVEILPTNGAECAVIEIVEKEGNLELHICGANSKFRRIRNYSSQDIL